MYNEKHYKTIIIVHGLPWGDGRITTGVAVERDLTGLPTGHYTAAPTPADAGR